MAESMDNLATALERAALSIGIELSDEQRRQLIQYFELLLKWNQKINLTAVRQPNEMASRHFAESLLVTTMITAPAGLMVDVGSGAGFPGLPLKVIWKTTPSVLLEPNLKKAGFLKEVIRQCGLSDIRVSTERLDAAAAGSLKNQAQLVTLRAVAVDEAVLEDLANLLGHHGQLALFVGEPDAQRLAHSNILRWESITAIPDSQRRVILLGRR